MALVQQGNNLHDDLIAILQPEYARLQYSLDIRNSVQEMLSMHGPFNFMSGPPTVKLSLLYYLDQNLKAPQGDILRDLELHIQTFLRKVDGHFIHRTVQPFDRTEYATTVRYEVVLSDFDNFENVIAELARQKAYKEFTKALESKLSED